MSETYAADRLVVQRGARFNRCNRSAKRPGVDPQDLALAVPFARLPGSSALLPFGCLAGRASPFGLMPALESCQGWTATVVAVAGAGGEATVVSVARVVTDGAASTIQRASSSGDAMAGLGGASSSGATGTSGVTFAVTTGWVFSGAVAALRRRGNGAGWSGGHREGDANPE